MTEVVKRYTPGVDCSFISSVGIFDGDRPMDCAEIADKLNSLQSKVLIDIETAETAVKILSNLDGNLNKDGIIPTIRALSTALQRSK